MPEEPQQLGDAEFEATVARLRDELRATGREEVDGSTGDLRARRELDRLWAVSADRPYLFRPGPWGRVRGLMLVPSKAVLRRLMRWYVEPLATDQRAFNAGVLRLADELATQLVRLDKRLDRLETGTPEAENAKPRTPH